MNDDIKNFIQTYRGMIDMYRPKVPAESAKLKKVEDYLKSMADMGSSCSDIGTFMTKVSEKNMLNEISALISDLAMESIAKQQASGQMKEPSVADAALGYHKAFEAIQDKASCPETCAVYERVFQLEKESARAGEFVRRMAEEKLFVKMSSAPLIEKFRPLVAQADSLSIPVMAYHNECMMLMAEKATSSIEMEYESNRLLELNRMELMCDELLMNDLYITLGGAISGYQISPTEENRQRVENSYRFVAEFFGLDDAELYAIPRVRDYIGRIIIPMLNKNEGGRKYTLDEYITEEKAVIAHCLKGKPPVAKGPANMKSAVLWGKSIPLEKILDAYRKPERPAGLMS